MAALLVSCGGDATDPPRVGQLDVTAHTFGGDPDLDGYVIVVNGVPGQAVDPGGGVRLTDLPAGEYEIGLTGVADNCDVQGESPRRVALPPGRTVSVVFDVECFTTGVGISVFLRMNSILTPERVVFRILLRSTPATVSDTPVTFPRPRHSALGPQWKSQTGFSRSYYRPRGSPCRSSGS